MLVTTRCIFLQPQESGDTGQDSFSLISFWVPIIMLPVWELGFPLDAKKEPEKPEIAHWNVLNLDSGIMVLLGFVKGLVR